MRAMVFCAGAGTRLRPLTRLLPKPLITVGGVSMVLRQLLALRQAGITEVVMNLAHGADAVSVSLGDGTRWNMQFHYSREGTRAGDALETLGGIAKSLDWLTDNGRLPYFVAVAGDIVTDYDYAKLVKRADAWSVEGRSADAHLVLVPNPSYHQAGDMVLSSDGKISRFGTGERLTFSSLGLYAADAFATVSAVRAPLFPWLWERRLTGEKYEGAWANVGDPAELTLARERWTGGEGDPVVHRLRECERVGSDQVIGAKS